MLASLGALQKTLVHHVNKVFKYGVKETPLNQTYVSMRDLVVLGECLSKSPGYIYQRKLADDIITMFMRVDHAHRQGLEDPGAETEAGEKVQEEEGSFWAAGLDAV